MEKKIDWNYDEFLTFVLLYASYVDMEFSDEEKNKIKEKVSEETFNKMSKIFNDSSDFEALQTILSYKGLYYPTGSRKQELLDNIKSVFFADGDYSIMERELYNFLEKLL